MNEKVLQMGIERFIEHRKKRIADLVNPNQEWNHGSKEFPAQIARVIAQGLNEEVGYFEEILRIAKTNDRKRTKKSL